ncbi:MAG: response regulator transcription factor [Chloroflexi bacterium]|nr:response regulator transcription factor [Chloroflexota bacterium]
MERIRILVADDHKIVREGIRAVLERAGFDVIGEASSGQEAVEKVRKHHPDVVLLDIRMPDGDGLQALEAIKSMYPDVRVIMLTTYANPGYLARAVTAGAAGYLTKEVDPAQIVRAIRAAVSGEQLLDYELLQMALRNVAAQAADISPADDELITPLTEQEKIILRLIVAGLSNEDIGRTLSITVNTVKTHIRHIFQKLGVSDRTQAAVWAVRHGLDK